VIFCRVFEREASAEATHCSVDHKVHAGEQLVPAGIIVEAFVLGVRHHVERSILALLLHDPSRSAGPPAATGMSFPRGPLMVRGRIVAPFKTTRESHGSRHV